MPLSQASVSSVFRQVVTSVPCYKTSYPMNLKKRAFRRRHDETPVFTTFALLQRSQNALNS